MVADLPNVVYSTKPHNPTPEQPTGVLVYMRTAEGNDSLAWIDGDGKSVTQSQLAILKAAECAPDTPALPRQEKHHELVEAGVRHMVRGREVHRRTVWAALGSAFSCLRTPQDLPTHIQGTLFATQELAKAIDEIYRYPLQQSAADTLNRQLRSGISDQQLADLVIALRGEARLCRSRRKSRRRNPRSSVHWAYRLSRGGSKNGD